MQVRRISQLVLKREHDFIDTVGLGCVETPTQVYIITVVIKKVTVAQLVLNFLYNLHVYFIRFL